MNKGLRSGLVLLVMGIIMGTLLAYVNSVTAPVIAANEESARYAALADFYNIDDYDLSTITINDDHVKTVFVLKQNNEIQALVYLVEANGYSSDKPISMLIAINKDLSIQGYVVVSHGETSGFGADIVNNDFGVTSIIDLSTFDSVAGVTYTSNGIYDCFTYVASRAGTDFGGGLDD